MSFLPLPPLWMKMTEGGQENTKRENRSLKKVAREPVHAYRNNCIDPGIAEDLNG
jgi:hypothetical protein